MQKTYVERNETVIVAPNPTEADTTTKLYTSCLAGCLAVAGVFESPDAGIALFLSHHNPTGDQTEGRTRIIDKIIQLRSKGFQATHAVVVRPGHYSQDEKGVWSIVAINTTDPDVRGYSEALGIVPVETTYLLPHELELNLRTDDEWGAGTAAIQYALEGEDNTPKIRMYVEGFPVQLGDK